MGTELPTKVMLGKTLVLMQMTFLNNVRKVGRLVLSRTCLEKQNKLRNMYKGCNAEGECAGGGERPGHAPSSETCI
jgi:hypothetical protein